MGRCVALHTENGDDVIIVYEEGVKKKAVKRDFEKPFYMSMMHKMKDGYEYENETFEHIKGDK